MSKPLAKALEGVANFVDGLSGIPFVGEKFGDAANSIRGFSKKINGDLDGLLTTALNVGNSLVGVGDGLKDGIAEKAPEVHDSFGSLMTIPEATTTRAITQATGAGEEIGTAVGKGASSAKVTEENSTALRDSITTSLEAATKVFEDWRGKVVGWLDLGSAFADANDYNKSLADEIAGKEARKTALLGQANRTDAEKEEIRKLGEELAVLGKDAGSKWTDQFTKQLTDATAFADQLSQLAPLLNPVLLEQVSAMGTEAGSQLAADLIANPDGLIDTLNNQQAALEAAGVKLGEDIVNAAGFAGEDYGMSFLYDEEKGLVATINAQKKRVKRDIKKALDTSVEVRVVYNADYSNAGPAYNGSGISSSPVSQIRSYERLNGTSWRK